METGTRKPVSDGFNQALGLKSKGPPCVLTARGDDARGYAAHLHRVGHLAAGIVVEQIGRVAGGAVVGGAGVGHGLGAVANGIKGVAEGVAGDWRGIVREAFSAVGLTKVIK
jgi:hypothetical protein